MSLVAIWGQEREKLVGGLRDGMPTDEAGAVVEKAIRGLVRPYADQVGLSARQKACATAVLESLAASSRRLLMAAVPRARFDLQSGLKLSYARPGLVDGPLWLAVVTVVSLALFVLFLRVLDPVVAIGIGVVGLLALMGFVITLARLKPPVAEFAAMFGSQSVPWMLRLMLGLLGQLHDKAQADAPEVAPKLVASSHIDRQKCLEWLRDVVLLTDRLAQNLEEPVARPQLWHWREGTTEALQDLLGATADDDPKRAKAAAERLRISLLSEGVRVVEPDSASDGLFEVLPAMKGPQRTLRPALVDAKDHRNVIALGQTSRG